MKTRFLFPHRYKKIGWVLLVASIALIIWTSIVGDINFLQNVKILMIYNSGYQFGNHAEEGFFKLVNYDITFSLVYILFIAGGLLVAFSKVKNEDEYIAKIRFESLLWAMYINFIFLILAIVCIWGLTFLTIIACNIFLIILLFIIRFHILLFKLKKSIKHEK